MLHGLVARHALTGEFWEEIVFFCLFWGGGREGGEKGIIIIITTSFYSVRIGSS